jgi:hypothetical protein
VTNTGSPPNATAISGTAGHLANLCISPNLAASITGFPPGTFTGSEFDGASVQAPAAQAASLVLYNSLNALTCTVNEPLIADIGGQTLNQPAGTTGVYCFPSSAAITGPLILNGPGNFVFLVGSSLTTAAGAPGVPASQIILTGGALASNVYWDIGTAGSGSATLGTYSIFQGRIISQDSVTANTGSTLLGSATALTAAVTLATTVVQQAF